MKYLTPILILALLLIAGCTSSIEKGFKSFCESEGKKLTDKDINDYMDYLYGKNDWMAFDIECDKQIYRVYCEKNLSCNKENKWGSCIDKSKPYECKPK